MTLISKSKHSNIIYKNIFFRIDEQLHFMFSYATIKLIVFVYFLLVLSGQIMKNTMYIKNDFALY